MDEKDAPKKAKLHVPATSPPPPPRPLLPPSLSLHPPTRANFGRGVPTAAHITRASPHAAPPAFATLLLTLPNLLMCCLAILCSLLFANAAYPDISDSHPPLVAAAPMVTDSPEAWSVPAPLEAYSAMGSWHPMTTRGTFDISMSWVMGGFSSLSCVRVRVCVRCVYRRVKGVFVGGGGGGRVG